MTFSHILNNSETCDFFSNSKRLVNIADTRAEDFLTCSFSVVTFKLYCCVNISYVRIFALAIMTALDIRGGEW